MDECYLEIETNTQEKKLANWNVKQIGLQKKLKEICCKMNSYARPDVRYCRDYLHSKCKQGLFGILEARLLTSQVRRLTGGSARALPTGNLLTREMSTIRANKMTKNRDLILNVNRPVGISHLVVHMRFYFAPKKVYL